MKKLWWLLGIAVLAGCSRTSTDTTVNANGTWTRTVRLTIPKTSMDGKEETFEKYFLLPSGANWKTSRTTDKDNQIFTAVRTLNAGESVQDLQVKAGTAVVANNDVTVRKIGENRFEYVETIHYKGPEKPDIKTATDKIAPLIKEALPADLATDEHVKHLSEMGFQFMWRTIFGPTEPLLTQILMNPDMAARRIKSRFARQMQEAMATEFGDKMTTQVRLDTVRKMINRLDAESLLDDKKEKAQKEGPSDNSSLVSMFTAVKLPGRIVESNGETDEITGEVIWAYFPESAQIGDVKLRAVCEITP